jgi:hypothetical protein
MSECDAAGAIDALIAYRLLDWDGRVFVLTDDGQAIYDRLVTGQDIPDQWWNGISD